MNHFIKSRNLPYSINEIKKITETCPACSVVKPRFHKSAGNLIKATLPFQQLNIDFKRPLPTIGGHKCLVFPDFYAKI